MSEAKVKIVEAAREIFSRYGVRRTSVGDVAEAAGVSRQTLYTHFKNKDELLAAVISDHTCEKIERLNAAWESKVVLGDILDAYFEHVIFAIFDVLQQMPDVQDLIHGIGDATAEVSKRTEHDKVVALTAQLLQFSDAFERHRVTPAEVAELVVRTGKELLVTAEGREELARLLNTLRVSVLALASETHV